MLAFISQAEWSTYGYILGGTAAIVLALWWLERLSTRNGKGKVSVMATRAGASVLELQSILEPSKKYVIEARKQKLPKEDGGGEPLPHD